MRLLPVSWRSFPAARPAAVLTAWLSLCAVAQPAPAEVLYATEREYFVEVPLVVTASRLLQTPDKAPASITVIDRRMIEASTAIDIPDLLRLVPGMQVTYANGNLYTVMYHGGETAWSHRMQVLVDGRSVYNPLFSIVPWNHLDIDIDDIERIEVIRGPNAPVYGSNAFRATINIITKQPFGVRGVSARAVAGSIETREIMARGAGGAERFDYRLTVRHRADEGFEGVNDHRDLHMVSFRGVYDPNASNSLDLQFGLTDGPIGAWGLNPVTSPERSIETRSGHAYLRWRRVFSPSNEAHLQLYHNYLDWDNVYEAGPISALFNDRGIPITPEQVEPFFGKPDQAFMIGRFHGKGTRSDLEWQQTLVFSDRWRMVWGAGLRLDTFESFQVLDQEGSVDDMTRRLFGNAEWSPSWRFGFNAGLMVEDDDNTGTHYSPRLAGNFTIVPGHTLRAIATRAVRFPSLYEAKEFNVVRFSDDEIFMVLYVSDPDLMEETIDSYEVGYRGLFADGRVDIDIKAYRERLRDLIFHARDRTYPDYLSEFLTTTFGQTGGDVGAFILMNSGNIDVNGAEMQLRLKPGPRTLLSLQYAYASLDGQSTHSIEDFVTGAPVAVGIGDDIARGTPRHTASALLHHRLRSDWHASVAWFHVSETEWAGDGQSLPRYNRWDARIGKRFRTGETRGDLSLIVHNLADREFSEFRRENVFDRRVFLQLKLQS